jgi:hypothetical protein
MNNPIAIHKFKDSSEVVKFIELEYFTTAFQELFNAGEIYGCYYSNSKIVALDNDGEEIENII